MTFVAPAGYQPVYSPVIPYLGPIYGGVREGMSIYIQGSIPDDITRFFVNLICGESESSDIALHFNPRFDGWDKVVFNSRQDGSWGQQEKIRKMPFSKRQAFEMLIIVTPQNYQIKVNGKDFFTFSHRIPVEKIHGIHVGGDVSIQTINILGGGFPGCGVGGGHPGGPGGCIGPGGFPGSHLPCMGGKPVYNPTLPYSSKIPGGMCPKRTIIIRGMVPHGGDSLRIDFVVSKSRDIAFHLNPRAKEGTVVRNSFIGKSWGKEERELSSMNPFIEGQYFDMSIRFGTQSFKVFVNGQHLFDFSHRIPFTEIDKLEMEGNMLISYIHF